MSRKKDVLLGLESGVIHFALEWGQEEWIATVLGLEDTEQEAVGSEKNGRPDQDSQLLTLNIFHAGNLQGKCDGSK